MWEQMNIKINEHKQGGKKIKYLISHCRLHCASLLSYLFKTSKNRHYIIILTVLLKSNYFKIMFSNIKIVLLGSERNHAL